MTQYQVKSVRIISQDPVTIRIYITLQRVYAKYFFVLFMPSTFLIVAAEMTLFVHKTHFEATMMVALTVTLVMYTLYESLSNTLPVSAGMKMVDIWMIHGLLIPFLVFLVLVHTNITQKRKRKVEKDKRKKTKNDNGITVQSLCQIAMPLMSVCFALGFFSYIFLVGDME